MRSTTAALGAKCSFLSQYFLQHVAAALHGVATSGGGVWKAPEHEIFSSASKTKD